MTATPSVLFVCVHNAGKSQMAAALLRLIAGDRIDVRSAGTQPDSEIHDLSAQAIAEVGADMSTQVPTALDPAVMRAVDRVIVLGAEADVAPIPGMRAPLTRWIIDDRRARRRWPRSGQAHARRHPRTGAHTGGGTDTPRAQSGTQQRAPDTGRIRQGRCGHDP